MNILFLTLVKIKSLTERGIYTDLLRKFKEEGNVVFVVSPSERRDKIKTNLTINEGVSLLNVRTFNMQKTNIIEKGIGTLAIEYQYLKAIKNHFSTIKFDLVLYSTPPITFSKVISFVKKRDNAYAYLLLKDIFPQNAVEMGMIKKNGLLFQFFRRKEINLYEISDTIGCMSPANVEFVRKHNPQIKLNKIEVCPNSIEPSTGYSKNNRSEIQKKYNLPLKKTIFIYGGNLGIAQGLDFLLRVISSNITNDAFFLVVGSGTEYSKLNRWFQKNRPQNACLLQNLTKSKYDELIQVCDVGLIFLDKRFTIPNYPSRLLSYLDFHMPVIAATDLNTDIGKIAENNNYGFWCENGDLNKMNQYIEYFINHPDQISQMGANGHNFLINNYTVETSYNIIMKNLIKVDKRSIKIAHEK